MRPDPFKDAPSVVNGAIFIADSHYNPLGRTEVLGLLNAIGRKEIETPQLFLMGDISDLLIGAFAYSLERNRALIESIDAVAASGIETWYFEGNHDFALKGVFDERVKIVAKSNQPKHFKFNAERVWLLHGDYRVELRYEIYAAFMRTKIGLCLTNILSLNFCNNGLLKLIERRQFNKRLRYDIPDFKTRRVKKIGYLIDAANLTIEGHFHQNCRFTAKESGSEARESLYCNLASFACEKSYLRIQSGENGAILREEKWER
jgi:UDP-2,3-diacylglucosamine hydrolase